MCDEGQNKPTANGVQHEAWMVIKWLENCFLLFFNSFIVCYYIGGQDYWNQQSETYENMDAFTLLGAIFL